MPIRPRYPVREQSPQPRPLYIVVLARSAGLSFNPSISYCLGVYGSVPFLQILRTSRWAMIARTDDATRNGFTPISISRATADGASFVWRVEKTKWPVSEA